MECKASSNFHKILVFISLRLNITTGVSTIVITAIVAKGYYNYYKHEKKLDDYKNKGTNKHVKFKLTDVLQKIQSKIHTYLTHQQ